MLKGAIVRIHKDAIMMTDSSSLLRLRQFFYMFKGWEAIEDPNMLDKIVVFTSPETFKQFLIEFAEFDVEQAMTGREAIDHLFHKGLTVKLIEE